MNGEPLPEEYDLYALGLSEGAELEQIREHLAAECPVCVPAVRASLSMVASLGANMTQTEPPKRLRGRIVAMVGGKPSAGRSSQFGWLAGLIAVMALLLVMIVGPRRTSVAETQLHQAVGLLSASDLKQLAVQNPGSSPRVDVFASRSRGVLLVASDFQPPPKGKTYEMWTVGKNAAPVAAGVFTPQRDGTVMHMVQDTGDALAVVAVTVEPEGGSEHPTTKPFLVAALP